MDGGSAEELVGEHTEELSTEESWRLLAEHREWQPGAFRRGGESTIRAAKFFFRTKGNPGERDRAEVIVENSLEKEKADQCIHLFNIGVMSHYRTVFRERQK